MSGGQHQVCLAHGRSLPHVDRHPEVKLLELLIGIAGVALVHVVAGLADAARHLVGLAGLDGTVYAVGVGPTRAARLTDAREVEGAQDDAAVSCNLALRAGDAHAQVKERPAGGGAAHAAGDVHVARDAADEVHGAVGLQGVGGVLQGEHVLDTAVAVTGGGVHAGGVGRGCLDDVLGRDLADLCDSLGVEGGHVVDEMLPHGAAANLLAVLQRDLDAAVLGVECGVKALGEGRQVKHEALRLAGEGQAGLVGLLAFRCRLPHLALPVRSHALALVVDVVLGVEPGELAGKLVDHDEAAGTPAFDEVGLLEQVVFRGAVARSGLVGLGVIVGVVHDEHGGVHPLADIEVVVELLVDDDVEPGKAHCRVGAGAQRQPDVGFLAQVGHARVDDDVGIGARCDIDGGAARVVVVGQLRCTAPLHIHAGTTNGLHPGVSVGGVHCGGVEARALADLVCLNGVGGVEALLVGAVGTHCPDAARAAHGEVGLIAVLVLELFELGAKNLLGLVPADALPTRIVGTLGVRALHGVLDAVGVIGGLQRCLALGAVVAHGAEAARVALGLDDLAVLDVHPDAALHLAAATASAPDLGDLAGLGCVFRRAVGQGGAGNRA